MADSLGLTEGPLTPTLSPKGEGVLTEMPRFPSPRGGEGALRSKAGEGAVAPNLGLTEAPSPQGEGSLRTEALPPYLLSASLRTSSSPRRVMR